MVKYVRPYDRYVGSCSYHSHHHIQDFDPGLVWTPMRACNIDSDLVSHTRPARGVDRPLGSKPMTTQVIRTPWMLNELRRRIRYAIQAQGTAQLHAATLQMLTSPWLRDRHEPGESARVVDDPFDNKMSLTAPRRWICGERRDDASGTVPPLRSSHEHVATQPMVNPARRQ